ncbi:MAG TPA: UDP-2,3-diacylglucosamine diphosphatase [Gammaproteobacteria bacterium]|jgi:UDP-2,3-diacylglucosamine hydrolase
MDTLFISDLHLSPARPEKLELFRTFLRGPARGAAAVYILGDLFEEFWAGNDDRTPPAAEIIGELKQLTGAGIPCYFLRGNRELVLDAGFESLTGCRVLPDPSVIDLGGARTLIMHGDRLCTRDWSYQLFRAAMESGMIRRVYLALPRVLRTALAHGLRPFMVRSMASKAPEIVDADHGAISGAMRAHGVTELIHGHTHRPSVHEFELDGRHARRIVLGDWYGDPLMLVCDGPHRHLMRVAEYLSEAG